jgi:hypothetical protein
LMGLLRDTGSVSSRGREPWGVSETSNMQTKPKMERAHHSFFAGPRS